MPRHNIGPVENYPVNEGVRIEVDGKAIAVFNTTGQYYAIDDECPKTGESMATGSVSGFKVTSAGGVTVDVRTGMCTPRMPPLEVYEVSCDSKELFVDV